MRANVLIHHPIINNRTVRLGRANGEQQRIPSIYPEATGTGEGKEEKRRRHFRRLKVSPKEPFRGARQ
jgi:hypothetical protein